MWYGYRIEEQSGDELIDDVEASEGAALYLIAERCAENYHSHHDGWESSWPVVFTIIDEVGTVLGKFEVEREAVPEFTATLVKEAK